MTRSGKIFFINFSCLFFFILDRFLKEILFLKGNFFLLKATKNPYFIFFFQGLPFYLFTFLIFVLLVVFLLKSYRLLDFFSIFSFSLILAGGFSNFLDRFFYGAVIDYFTFFSFSVFNLADIMIAGGVILLIFKLLFRDFKIKKI